MKSFLQLLFRQNGHAYGLASSFLNSQLLQASATAAQVRVALAPLDLHIERHEKVFYGF